MYAVVKTGGKQYKVSEGEILRVEKLEGSIGDKIKFDEVLMIGGEKVKIGTPTVAKAHALCEIAEQGKDRKIIVFRRKKKKYSKKTGHRQPFTAVRIKEIKG